MLNHILVVDDDKGIRFLISKFLQEHGYIVNVAANIAELNEIIKIFKFDLIILDVMLPGVTGVEYLKQKQDSTPVILLTALGDIDDRINGLESGADDYLSKPFEPKELLLRMQNILKRKDNNRIYEKCLFGEYEYELLSHNLKFNNNLIKLTTNESKIMEILASSPGEIVSREKFLELFPDINARTIDVIVARIRVKIEEDSKNPEFLQTIRNQGYVLWGKLQ